MAQRQLLRFILENEYEVIEAADGSEALSMIKKNKTDLILLNNILPGKNGIDVCKELKKDFATRLIPVILITQRVKKEETITGLTAGADDYLVKPVDPPELLARLASLMRTKGYYSQLIHEDLVILLELSKTISASRNPPDILQAIVNKTAELTQAARCSIVHVSRDRKLVVRASSDLETGREIDLDLNKYPEVECSLENSELIVINDLHSNPVLSPVKGNLESSVFKSLAIVPISDHESISGALFLRLALNISNGINERIIKLSQLVANISYSSLENAILFNSMRTAQNYLEKMAITDGLTSLYNHRYFYDRLESEFSIANRYKSSLSCIFMDIDDFKKINDSYGHKTGDKILTKIGSLIKTVVRESDIAARYGGEEFAVLLPQTGDKGAMEIAGRLHTVVRDYIFDQPVGGNVTVSLGVSTFLGGSDKSLDYLVQSADKAMYKAKSMGKDRIYQIN